MFDIFNFKTKHLKDDFKKKYTFISLTKLFIGHYQVIKESKTKAVEEHIYY